MPRIRSALLSLLAGTGWAAALAAAPALAQAEGAPAAGSNPLVLTVRPSGYETGADSEAQARQERLLKRMEQADYSVRSICVNCGDGWKHQTYAPFNPLQSLRLPHPSDD
ncbi:hypothetical protein [Microvirga thermotolerans]|uniref:Uncharacterized protein n=1 Tax=Microvirga thermotolerans TaxID=2651334 RepID=A0A5P9JVR5_9HYPH|nr:hypothetical protein [Microvirga thermotolerans]QFU15746.1 hypothetical protein GDR74_05660 [Microvirga thermotolerans]